METDAIDKKNQSEVLNEREDLGRTGETAISVRNAGGIVDVTDHNARKEHESHAKRDTSDLDLAKVDSDGDYNGVE